MREEIYTCDDSSQAGTCASFTQPSQRQHRFPVLSLAELNFLRTGVKTAGLLDVHYVTDDDVRRQTSYAVKIGAVTDAARKLPMKGPRGR